MNEIAALLVGTALAVGAFAFVLYPMFFRVADRAVSRASRSSDADDSAIVALREIEFDRATGKLSDRDYAELRKTYGDRALREMRGAPDAAVAPPLDPIEARVRAYRMTHRECPTCGLRPEPDAIYCSTCGGYLDRVCPECAAEIAEPSAAFCSRCGAALAALARGRASAFASF
ncbi:MAG TPA: zinc ribbon domain-containing protein [Gemmatimonadaceae bacterium]